MAGEAALGHMLAVPGQLLPTTAPPADTPALPVVFPAAKYTYAEAAVTPALNGAIHVYVQHRGVGLPRADNYGGPYLVLEKGPKVFKLQLGERTEVVSRDWLNLHAGQVPPAAAEPPRRGRPPQRVVKIFLETSQDLRGVVLWTQEICRDTYFNQGWASVLFKRTE